MLNIQSSPLIGDFLFNLNRGVVEGRGHRFDPDSRLHDNLFSAKGGDFGQVPKRSNGADCKSAGLVPS